MCKLKYYLLSLLLAPAIFLAATETKCSTPLALDALHAREEKAAWEKYTANGEEFSVLMPEPPGMIARTTCLDYRCNTKRQEYVYAAYSDGGVYLVTSYQNPKRREPFDAIINDSLDSLKGAFEVVFQGETKLKEFAGKKYLLTSKSGGYDRMMTFYLTRDHVYEVAAVNEKRDDPSIQKFFASFAPGDKTGKDIGKGARAAEIFTPPVSKPVAPKPAATPDRNIPGVTGGGVGPAVGNGGGVGGPQIFKPNEVMRKATIVLKASPEYTEEARRKRVTGTVTLQLVLTSAGSITNIRIVSGLPYGLTEKAVGAARKIYFIPAIKDGKRVSQYVRVEYNFNIY
jgi:TonB family protein